MTKTRQVFFCPPKKKKKKKSKSMSDRELELSGTEAYDEVYQAQNNLSTAPPPNTSNCTITLLAGLNNDTDGYPLIFNTIEYQSYDIFDKKIRVLLEIYSSANLLLIYEQEKDCRVKLNEKKHSSPSDFLYWNLASKGLK